METLFLITVIYVSIIMCLQIVLNIRGYFKFEDDVIDSDFNPTVSIIIPAYNEEKTIISSVKSALNQTYDKFEVIVVDDGSTDETLGLLIDFKLENNYDNLQIIHKVNGGKFSALNKGMDVSESEWILAVDADSFLLPETIQTLVDKKREDVVAMTCGVGMINGCEVEDGELIRRRIPSNPLVISQMIEYLRTFVMLKMSLNDKNGTAIISGACGFFDRKYVQGIGGYKDRITEDAEMTLRIHENGGKVQFVSDILSYTEAPSNVRILHRQRMRWVRGLLKDIWEYKSKVKTKSIKRFVIPYFLIADYILPWVEIGGWISFGISLYFAPVALPIVLLSLGLLYILYLMNNMVLLFVGAKKMKLAMEYQSKWKIFLYSLFDLVYYRPLILFFVIKAQMFELFGRKYQWGNMRRKGF